MTRVWMKEEELFNECEGPRASGTATRGRSGKKAGERLSDASKDPGFLLPETWQAIGEPWGLDLAVLCALWWSC